MSKPTPEIKYTLVQHSGYGYNQRVMFKQAVEMRSVNKKLAERIAKSGGVLFDSYTDARLAEDDCNYPPGVFGLVPKAPGTFGNIAVDGLRIYLPPKDHK